MDLARATEVGSLLHLIHCCKSNLNIEGVAVGGVVNSEASAVEFDLSSIFHKSIISGVILKAFSESKYI